MQKIILVMLSMSIFLLPMGCVTINQAMPQKPIPPDIEAHTNSATGEVCYDKEDAYLLWLYINQLEKGYDR